MSTTLRLEKYSQLPNMVNAKTMRRVDVRTNSTLAFFRRTPKQINIAVGGTGLNLHRKGGVSITGIPRTGGTTVCWGALREWCEQRDADERPDAWVGTTGRIMVRIGSDF